MRASRQFSFSLNGRSVEINNLPPQTTLLDFIRSQGLTGAKEGCAEGECGACAVLVVRELAGRTALQAVNSCLIPLPNMADSEVYTVEALASKGRLAQVQQAMIDAGGSQCGYCTPGFIVSMFAAQANSTGKLTTEGALGGNLCRCTGYRSIVAALASLPGRGEEPLHQRLSRPPSLRSHLSYDTRWGCFSRPISLSECLELKAKDPEARFIAGATDLGVIANLKHVRFPHLISLDLVPELHEMSEDPQFVEIGAGLTLTELEHLWRQAPAILDEWLPMFASRLIRNRATLGGNLMTASPIGDAAPLLLALDAQVRLSSATGDRCLDLAGFFTSYRQTAAEPAELLRSIVLPKPFPRYARFYKVSKRRLDDISTVAGCFSMDIDTSGRLRNVRLAFGGVGPAPLRALSAEQALEATFGNESDWEQARQALAGTLNPISDHRGSADYRLALAQSLIAKFQWEHQERLMA